MSYELCEYQHRRLAAIGVPVYHGVPVADPFADAEPSTAARVGGGREALRRSKVLWGIHAPVRHSRQKTVSELLQQLDANIRPGITDTTFSTLFS
jgi:hypothetical protein